MRVFWASVIVVGLVAAMPVAARAETAGEDKQIAAYVAADGKGPQSMALEPGALAAAGGRVKRAGPVLTFDLANGSEGIRLEDRTDCKAVMKASDCQQFFLVAALPSRHCYIVAKGHYEGTAYLLIDDRTGKGSAFPGPPRFAAKGNAILVLNNNELADGPAIEIWTRDAEGGTVLEWLHPIDGDEVAKVDRRASFDTVPQAIELTHWAGDRIDLVLRYPAINDRKPVRVKARISRVKGAWQFAVLAPT